MESKMIKVTRADINISEDTITTGFTDIMSTSLQVFTGNTVQTPFSKRVQNLDPYTAQQINSNSKLNSCFANNKNVFK